MKKIYLSLVLLFVAGNVSAATLNITPSSGTYASGSTFTVSVMLDTTGAAIDGVDVRYLRFNPNILQVVDASSNSGVQVAAGSLMPMTLTNTVDNSSGLITFSQVVAGGQHYTGAGTLFTVTFQAISGGSPSLTFDAVSGRTTDTNVAANGIEVLTSAGSASYTISGTVTPGAANPSPTPAPTPVPGTTPTPTPTTPGGALTVSLSRTLSIGSSGNDVTTLQNFLISAGFLAPGNAVGYYGNLTRAAVKAFQCSKGLTCSGNEATTGYGMVGARTRALLAGGTSAPITPAPSGGSNLTTTIYIGAKGAQVVALQNILIRLGYLASGLNTGTFGPATQSAVRRFQCEKMQICSGSEGTTGYGLVGARTRAALAQ